MTKRQAIANDFITLAKTITTANGYFTNLATTDVSHWQNRTLSATKTQYLDIKDGINEHQDGDDGTYQVINLRFEFGIKGSTLYTKATNLIQDIYKAVYNSQSTFETKYGYFRILPVEDDFEIDFEKSEEIVEGHVTFEVWHTAQNKWTIDTTNYS